MSLFQVRMYKTSASGLHFNINNTGSFLNQNAHHSNLFFFKSLYHSKKRNCDDKKNMRNTFMFYILAENNVVLV